MTLQPLFWKLSPDTIPFQEARVHKELARSLSAAGLLKLGLTAPGQQASTAVSKGLVMQVAVLPTNSHHSLPGGWGWGSGF